MASRGNTVSWVQYPEADLLCPQSPRRDSIQSEIHKAYHDHIHDRWTKRRRAAAAEPLVFMTESTASAASAEDAHAHEHPQLRFRGSAALDASAETTNIEGDARYKEQSTRGLSVLQRVMAGSSSVKKLSRGFNLAAFDTASTSGDEDGVVWHDADYCLYFELVQGAGDEHAHVIVEAVGAALRDVGCHVSLYPLQQYDAEIPAENQEETLAYVMTVCSAFMTASPPKATIKQAQLHVAGISSISNVSSATALWAQALPRWITEHAAFKLVASLSAGGARSQQLTRLILKELRVSRDVVLNDGRVLLKANERVIKELARHEDALRIQIFPLHRDSERDKLITTWSEQFAFRLPLADVFAYFGPKLAMYFAWLEFYTEMLLIPAIAGVVVYVLGLFDAESYCILTFVVSMCTSVFVDYWRRRQREVEYKWKYRQLMETDAVVDLETRPQFKGEWMIDEVTGARIYDFPHDKRFRRQLLAIPLILFMCALVGAYVVALNMLSEHLRGVFPACYIKNESSEFLEREGSSVSMCLSISQGPGVLNAVIIQVLDKLYQKLARRLNEYENYRTTAEFEEHLVIKRMPFHFVNSNASLWFLAFYVRDLDRVRDRLWILMVLMQLLDNFKEVGLPFVVSLTAQLFTSEGKRRPSTAAGLGGHHSPGHLQTLPERLQRVLTQKRQAHYVDTFADYKEMMVQYGYVALYTPIFPLAPLFAWLNNVVESRSDFFKLVNSNGFQRPLVRHTHGIGVWERVLVSFSVIAVIINCAFVWTYEIQQLLPEWSDLHRFMLLVGCEHLVFFAKALLNWASPDLPTWIQNEKRIRSLSSTHAQLLRSPRKRMLQHQHTSGEGASHGIQYKF